MSEYSLTDDIISELVRRVTDAQEIMLKHEIEANTVILNNRKYAALVDKLKWYPTICGLKAEIAPLMDDVDFIVQRRPLTNADRIRSMDDVELAEFLWDVWKHKDPFYKECVDGWLVPFCHWLKQEAE